MTQYGYLIGYFEAENIAQYLEVFTYLQQQPLIPSRENPAPFWPLRTDTCLHMHIHN